VKISEIGDIAIVFAPEPQRSPCVLHADIVAFYFVPEIRERFEIHVELVHGGADRGYRPSRDGRIEPCDGVSERFFGCGEPRDGLFNVISRGKHGFDGHLAVP